MLLRPHRALSLVVVAGVLLTIASCSRKPTYPKEQLVESLNELFAQEGLTTTVRLLDHTLAIQFEYPEALSYTGEVYTVGPGLEDGARKAITVIHRILLSSDSDVRFYLLLMSNPEVPGAYLTMVRYVEDIRKVNWHIIGMSEMMARTFWNLQVVEDGPLMIDRYLSRDIVLSDFLTWQLTQRIEQELTEALQSSGVAAVGRSQGQFDGGEFLFVLNVAPTSTERLDDETMRLMFDTTTKLIAKVLSDYEFEAFDTVRLIHPLTGQNLVTPRAKLEFFH